tara:strand:+ start:329 stop:739 length:411 start_codon:yes stop_codon:yes gene_type:complete
MGKLLIILSLFALNLSYGQMISVTGGNLTFMNNDKGFIEVEAMQHLVKNVDAHISYTKVMGGKDIAMVGGRYGLFEQKVGIMISACFMENHKTMGMVGIDVKPLKHSPISIIYSQSTDSDLKQLGIKFPLFNKNKH